MSGFIISLHVVYMIWYFRPIHTAWRPRPVLLQAHPSRSTTPKRASMKWYRIVHFDHAAMMVYIRLENR